MRIIIIVFALLISCNANAAVFMAKPVLFADSLSNSNNHKLTQLTNTSLVQLEKYLGRKLKFKEKIALKVLKFKLKSNKNSFENVSSKHGKTSLTLGILSLVLFSFFL